MKQCRLNGLMEFDKNVIYPFFEDEGICKGVCNALGYDVNKAFEARYKKVYEVYTLGKLKFKKFIFVCLGKKKDIDEYKYIECFREVSGHIDEDAVFVGHHAGDDQSRIAFLFMKTYLVSSYRECKVNGEDKKIADIEIFMHDGEDIKEIYSIMSDEELSSTKQKVEELRKEKRRLEGELAALETDIVVENMARNQELVGKCFVNGNNYYKVVGSFGADKYSVYCLCLNFDKEICNYYRVSHIINGPSRYCTLSTNHPIKIELIAKGNLGKEIESYIFEEKMHEIADKILNEADNLNEKLYGLYKEDVECIGEEDLEKRKAIKRAFSEDHLC